MNKRRKKKNKFTSVQKTIMAIIALAFIIVIFFALFTTFYTPENNIKSKISNLAKDYYENYLYELISDNSSTPAEALKGYTESGLSVVYLRQLLYYSNEIDTETIDYLTTHCNENNTTIKYYPEPPFSKTSYHIDFTYSCDF